MPERGSVRMHFFRLLNQREKVVDEINKNGAKQESAVPKKDIADSFD